MTARVFAAVDLGASSGRVVAGIVDAHVIDLDVVHRFPNAPVEREGHLRWDFGGVYQQVLAGLAALATRYPQVESIGIDTWGIDYGLLDANGALLAEPISYRDARTARGVDAVHARIGRDELYRIDGVQFLPFNTIYQLAAEAREDRWEQVAHIALLPDLVAFWLTGALRTEFTIATTTGLVDLASGNWSNRLLDVIDVPAGLLPPIEAPGTVRGRVRPEVITQLGLPASTVVTAVGSHDTASAVAAVPATGPGFAYISSGTWSLVGVELDEPIVNDAARDANFTNEGGLDGRVRFLRNVGGLWLLQECVREWNAQGTTVELTSLLGAAATLPPGGPIFDVDDATFVAPGDVPARIARRLVARGDTPPTTPATMTRCIVDSLAAANARAIVDAEACTGHEIDSVHVVGGGAQNELLCRLTAQTTERPVIAGPVEATALGNVLVQARTHGALPRSLEDLRARVARSTPLARFGPTPTRSAR